MSGYNVSSTNEKTYVHNHFGMCVARLCATSAEFTVGCPIDGKLDIIEKCSFDHFKTECLKRYNIAVDDKYIPLWAK